LWFVVLVRGEVVVVSIATSFGLTRSPWSNDDDDDDDDDDVTTIDWGGGGSGGGKQTGKFDHRPLD
jgi:hypothetical protein